jgi:hypothetical protein
VTQFPALQLEPVDDPEQFGFAGGLFDDGLGRIARQGRTLRIQSRRQGPGGFDFAFQHEFKTA